MALSPNELRVDELDEASVNALEELIDERLRKCTVRPVNPTLNFEVTGPFTPSVVHATQERFKQAGWTAASFSVTAPRHPNAPVVVNVFLAVTPQRAGALAM